MSTDPAERPPLEEPLAQMERELIRAYLAGAGQDRDALVARDDEGARRLLAEASRHAAGTLAQVEARLHYLRHLRGEA